MFYFSLPSYTKKISNWVGVEVPFCSLYFVAFLLEVYLDFCYVGIFEGKLGCGFREYAYLYCGFVVKEELYCWGMLVVENTGTFIQFNNRIGLCIQLFILNFTDLQNALSLNHKTQTSHPLLSNYLHPPIITLPNFKNLLILHFFTTFLTFLYTFLFCDFFQLWKAANFLHCAGLLYFELLLHVIFYYSDSGG